MDRRFAHLPALVVAMLGVLSVDLAPAATQCGIDSAPFANGDKLAPMATVVSSASTRPADDATAPAKDKPASAAPANAGGGSNPTTAGGGIAAGSGEEGVLSDGGAPAGTHKRGLRWHSFLPGMIR